MTEESKGELHSRMTTFLNNTLIAHGVVLHGAELKLVAAQVTDFCITEVEKASTPLPKRKK